MLRISKYGAHDNLGTINSVINGMSVSVMSFPFPFLFLLRKEHCCTALSQVTKYILFKARGIQRGAIFILWNIQ